MNCQRKQAAANGATRIASGSPDAVDVVRELRGAAIWARQMVVRGLRSSQDTRYVQPALINGLVGVVLAPRGKLSQVVAFTFGADKITRVEVIGDPARLRELDITVL